MKRILMVRFLALATFLTVFAPLILADVPPDPGFKRVSTSIVLETNEEFKDYRFFVVSSNLAREVLLKKGEKTSVGPIGGGARYRSGTLVAIPAKSLVEFGDNPVDAKKREMEDAIASGSLAGRIELIQHQFVTEVRDSEASDVTDSAYRIERTKGSLTAVPLNENPSEKKPSGGVSIGVTDISRSITPFGIATIIAGILMTASIVAFGFWFISRRSNKRA